MLKRFSTFCSLIFLSAFAQHLVSDPAAAQEVTTQIGKPAPLDPNVVGAGGEFTYSFPFDLPEYHGLVPNLRLSYNSSNTSNGGVDNIVAVGWRLAGLSKIDRVSVGGGVPTFDAGQDLFRLDGAELMACDDTAATNKWTGYYPLRYLTDTASASCTAGGNFSTLVESYQKIVYNKTTNEFWVTQKNGHRYHYRSIGALLGNTSTSGDLYKFSHQSRWLLTDITDAQRLSASVTPSTGYSNKVSISYSFGPQADGFPEQVSEISYGGYFIEFAYVNFAEPRNFGTGTSVLGAQHARLTSVAVYSGDPSTANSRKIRAYEMVRQASALTGAILLNSVQSFGSNFKMVDIDGVETAIGPYVSANVVAGQPTKLPDVRFEYSEDSLSLQSTLYSGKEFKSASATEILDWDSNGSDDLVFKGTTNTIYKFDAENVISSIASGTLLGRCDYVLQQDPLSAGLYCLNADVRLDYVTSANQINYVYDYFWARDWASSNSEIGHLRSADYILAGPPVNAGAGTAIQKSAPSGLGNFDLDPESEMTYHKNLYEVNDGNFVSSAPTNKDLTGYISDFTGDGVDDFLNGTYLRTMYFEGGYSVDDPTNRAVKSTTNLDLNRFSRGEWRSEVPVSVDMVGGNFQTRAFIGYADLNGDGLTDLVGYDTNETADDDILVYYSTGFGFKPLERIAIGAFIRFVSRESGQTPSALAFGAHIRDLNGDGRPDIVLDIPSDNYWAGAKKRILMNSRLPTGKVGFVYAPEPLLTAQSKIAGIGDFDGNGLPDFMLEGAQGAILFNEGMPSNRLLSVTDQSGGITQVTYGPSSQFGTNQMPGVQQVVTKIESFDGRHAAWSLCSTYSYVGGRYDFIHRKTLGYHTVSVQRCDKPGQTAGPITVTTYLNTNIAEYGSIKSRVTTAPNGAGDIAPFSREINTWDVNFAGHGPYSALKTSSRTAELYGATLFETEKEYSYNIFGEPTQIVDYGATSDGVDSVAGDNLTTVISYAPNLVSYIVDRPSVKRLVTDVTLTSDSSTWKSFDYYYYDGATAYDTSPTVGNLTQVRKWDGVVGSGIYRKMQAFSYDLYGNVTEEFDSKGIYAATPYASVTNVYDPYRHLFRISTENALGHISTTSWDVDCQKATFERDPNLSSTSYEYDTLCRETKQTLPNGSFKETNYVAFGDPKKQYIGTTSPKLSTNPTAQVSQQRQYFDGLGRVYKSASSGSSYYLADFIVTLTGYDLRGNVRWQSNPVLWADLASDASGLDIVPLAKQTRFDYDALNRPTNTILPDGSVETKSYAGLGLNIYGGGVTYPGVISRNADCGATGALPPCIEIQEYFDHANRKVRERQTDSATSPSDAPPLPSAYRDTTFSYDPLGRLEAINKAGILWDYTYDGFGNRVTALDPGLSPPTAAGPGTPWQMVYDVNGNLTRQTDAKGQVITFAYDRLNRVTSKSVTANGTTKTTISTYDEITGRSSTLNKGRLTTLETTGGHSIEYDYDRMGQVKFQRQTIDGTRTFALSTDYGDHGEVLRYFLPNTPGSQAGAYTAAMAYDAAGRLSSWPTLITSIDYDPRGNPTAIDYANGAKDAYEYSDTRGWVLDVNSNGKPPLGSTSAPLFASTSLTRSDSGRIEIVDKYALGLTPNPGDGTSVYAYDYAGRLKSVKKLDGTIQQAFVYDGAGRMRSNTDVGTYTYYGLTNPLKPLQAPSYVTSPAGVNTYLSYDANGNMLTGLDAKVMAYDGENRPLSVFKAGKCTAYVYGADGTRLKKIEVPTSTATACQTVTAATPGANVTVTFGMQEFRNYGQGTAEEILSYPLPNIRFTYTAANRTHSVLHRDHQGSVLAITNSAGARVQTSLYTPFGKQTNWVAVPTAEPETKGYIGERFDADAGLQYLNARYYDPKLAMFIQPDWWEVMQAGVGPNRYGYCSNDPTNCTDPSGHQDAGSISSEEEDKKLHDSCTNSGGCFHKLNEFEEMLPTAFTASAAVIGAATGVTEVAALVAAVRAPAVYYAAMEIATVEATGMTVAAGGAAALTAKAASVWGQAPIPRGNAIETMLGANLPRAFPVVDKLANGVATSIKSVDLNAATYQSAANLGSKLTGHVDRVIGFSKATHDNVVLEQGRNFVAKSLEIAIPNAPSVTQQGAIDRAIDYGQLNGVNVFTTIVP